MDDVLSVARRFIEAVVEKFDSDPYPLKYAVPYGAFNELRGAVEKHDGHNGMDTDDVVRFYEHDFYVLSNFSAFNLQWNGYAYPTSEHAYQASKFSNYREDIARMVATAPSAHEAFKIAELHKAERRPDWDEVKVATMYNILLAKAEQHEYVRRKLLATGDRELVEDSWRDNFWGWGRNRDGKNMLGKLWMQVRVVLRNRELGSVV